MAASGVVTLEQPRETDPFPPPTHRSGATVPSMGDRCDSCGDDGPDLVTVQRVYLVFNEHQQPVDHRLADEFETWCPACRVTYPHQEVDASSG